jgi:hypothetical protein
MDSYPKDTGTTRGGNGVVDNLDLIETLARVTNIDTSQPLRGTRGLTCPDINGQAAPARKTPEGPTVAWLEKGSVREDGRIPIYLSNDSSVSLVGLSFLVSVTDPKEKSTLTFVPAEGFNPTLTDNGVDGMLAIAWLNGMYATPGRILLGYVEGARSGLSFGAVVANTRDGSTPRIDFREAR